MRKRIVFKMCLLLCLTLFVHSTQAFASDDVWNEIRLMELVRLQERAVEANDNINNAMGYTEIGTIDYEDDFGAARIEENKLVIYTTDCSDENKNKYLAWAGEYSDVINFQEAEYSYNYLLGKGEEVLEVLHETIGQTELTYYVSEANNSIVVLMDEETKNALEKQRTTISFDVPVVFEENSDYSLSATDVKGGSALLNATTLQSMSVGCCGYYRGVRSIATCGHGSSAVGNKVYCEDTSLGYVGNITYRNFGDGISGDYAIISDSSSNSNFNFTNKIGGTYTVTGMITSPAVNTYVYFYGSTTQTYCLGQVTERGLSANVTVNGEGITISGLSAVLVASGNVAAGDSGGAVFTVTSGTTNAKFAGVITGSSTSSGSLIMCFTPASYFSAIGFTVMTS